MEKLKKSYVEKRYKEKAEISEVMERDPMKIQNDGEICAFRFFDKEINANGEEKYDGEKSNFSKWIFFGKRMMLRELENSYGTNPDLVDYMDRNNLKFICHTQGNTFVIMGNDDMTFEEMVVAKEREEAARKMFENLKNHIGENVSYTAWHLGMKLKEKGWLNGVDDFKYVEIVNEKGWSELIPFVGYRAAIYNITSENGEVLYENRCAEFRYDGQKEADILDFKKFTFGDNILDIEREEEEKMNAQIKEIREKINKEAQKEKYRLMKEELELIKPETKTVSNYDLSVGKK